MQTFGNVVFTYKQPGTKETGTFPTPAPPQVPVPGDSWTSGRTSQMSLISLYVSSSSINGAESSAPDPAMTVGRPSRLAMMWRLRALVRGGIYTVTSYLGEYLWKKIDELVLFKYVDRI